MATMLQPVGVNTFSLNDIKPGLASVTSSASLGAKTWATISTDSIDSFHLPPSILKADSPAHSPKPRRAPSPSPLSRPVPVPQLSPSVSPSPSPSPSPPLGSVKSSKPNPDVSSKPKPKFIKSALANQTRAGDATPSATPAPSHRRPTMNRGTTTRAFQVEDEEMNDCRRLISRLRLGRDSARLEDGKYDHDESGDDADVHEPGTGLTAVISNSKGEHPLYFHNNNNRTKDVRAIVHPASSPRRRYVKRGSGDANAQPTGATKSIPRLIARKASKEPNDIETEVVRRRKANRILKSITDNISKEQLARREEKRREKWSSSAVAAVNPPPPPPPPPPTVESSPAAHSTITTTDITGSADHKDIPVNKKRVSHPMATKEDLAAATEKFKSATATPPPSNGGFHNMNHGPTTMTIHVGTKHSRPKGLPIDRLPGTTASLTSTTTPLQTAR